MTILNFDHTIDIAVPPQELYAVFTDPHQNLKLAPLLVEVRDITHTTNAEGQTVILYDSVELFRFLGFIKYHNVIHVTATLVEPNRRFVNEVKSPANVQVRFENTLTPIHAGTATRLDEHVTLSCPSFLRGFVYQNARSSQLTRFERLKAMLENKT